MVIENVDISPDLTDQETNDFDLSTTETIFTDDEGNLLKS